MVVANADGATVRADINSNLQALASTSKGSTAPATIYTGQQWIEDDSPSSGEWTLKVYDGADSINIGGIDINNNLFLVSGANLRGLIGGLVPSNNGLDASNDIDVSIGMATDDTHAHVMRLTSSITKRLDAAWAVGTNQGGLDTGAKAASTWYHLYLIRRPDTGVVDVLFSTSASSPTMPTNYTQKRRIGSVRTDGSSNIYAFTAIEGAGGGLDCIWSAIKADVVSSSVNVTTAVTRTLTVPTGIKVRADIAVAVQTSISTTGTYLHQFRSPDASDEAVSTFGYGALQFAAGTSGTHSGSGTLQVWTDTSATIRSRSNGSTNPDNIWISTRGWFDARRP
jgi:hypothetical protein